MLFARSTRTFSMFRWRTRCGANTTLFVQFLRGAFQNLLRHHLNLIIDCRLFSDARWKLAAATFKFWSATAQNKQRIVLYELHFILMHMQTKLQGEINYSTHVTMFWIKKFTLYVCYRSTTYNNVFTDFQLKKNLYKYLSHI